MKILYYAIVAGLMASLAVQQTLSAEEASAIFEHTKAATVIILAGEGAGRLRTIASGIIISQDGAILTALHAVKGAAEVQVRMANGEVFDRVELLGSDETSPLGLGGLLTAFEQTAQTSEDAWQVRVTIS